MPGTERLLDWPEQFICSRHALWVQPSSEEGETLGATLPQSYVVVGGINIYGSLGFEKRHCVNPLRIA